VNETNKFSDFKQVREMVDQEQATLRIEKLLAFVKTTGEKCVDLLTAFYYDNDTMQTIANKFGFSGERSATVQKFKCLEKIRNSIKTKSLTYEDFMA
jgi:hypothetical protein